MCPPTAPDQGRLSAAGPDCCRIDSPAALAPTDMLASARTRTRIETLFSQFYSNFSTVAPKVRWPASCFPRILRYMLTTQTGLAARSFPIRDMYGPGITIRLAEDPVRSDHRCHARSQQLPPRAVALKAALTVLLAFGPVVEARAATGSQPMSRADYEACQTRDEAAFRTAVQSVIAGALDRSISTVDYTALVTDLWRDGNLDKIVDTRVDLAVAEVRDETSWGSLIKSLGSKDKAQELATAVAERVYRSEAMKAALEEDWLPALPATLATDWNWPRPTLRHRR